MLVSKIINVCATQIFLNVKIHITLFQNFERKTVQNISNSLIYMHFGYHISFYTDLYTFLFIMRSKYFTLKMPMIKENIAQNDGN